MLSYQGKTKVGIGLFGLGRVGSWVAEGLHNTKFHDPNKTGIIFDLKRIVDIEIDKYCKKLEELKLNQEIASKKCEDIFLDPTIEIVGVFTGDYESDRSLILESFKSGKHVVTATKFLAEFGPEVYDAARKYDRRIGFETSVCGEAPVIKTLLGTTAYLKGIIGIFNSTTNFMLSRMEEGVTYEKAHELALKKGFAEPDPSFDVKGKDTAYKLGIMIPLAFGSFVEQKQIYQEGIEGVTNADTKYANEWGYVIKLVGEATLTDEGLKVAVYRAFLQKSHPLANVRDENTAVTLCFSDGSLRTISGVGAGKPVARAAISDMVDIATNRMPLPTYDEKRHEKIINPCDYINRFYLRFSAQNIPMVLGGIANALGNHGVNIAQALQIEKKIARDGTFTPIAIETYDSSIGVPTRNKQIFDALEDIGKLGIAGDRLFIRMYE